MTKFEGFNKRQTKVVKNALGMSLNVCTVLNATMTDNEVRFEVSLRNCTNCFDSASINALLMKLKALGIVREATQTMWFGIKGTSYVLWCRR